MIPSALSQAKRDPRIRGAALAAYVFCLEYLDATEWRAVKIEQIVVGIRCSKPSAVYAMRSLAAAGYVAVRGRQRPREYRLLPAPMLAAPVKRCAA